MANIDQLEARKKELELQRDIARLERNAKFKEKAADVITDMAAGAAQKVQTSSGKAKTWSWLWVGPAALVGGFFALAALESRGGGDILILSVLATALLLPAVLKLLGQR